MLRHTSVPSLVLSVALPSTIWAQAPARRAVTVDDLMGLRTIVDAKISPAGDRVAYVVSTPSVERNMHEAALFVVSTTGGAPTAFASGARVFTPALPAPRLRWMPDGSAVTFLAHEGGPPQVYAASPASTDKARAVTSAPAGVFAYEWSADGKSLAYLTREPAGPAPPATRAGAPPPATRLWVQFPGEIARAITPENRYVDSFSWSPDGTEIAYASSPVSGFLARYSTRIEAVALATGQPRSIVDRGGMNASPVYSPDGRHIAFVTTTGRTDIMAPRGLAVVPASGGAGSSIRPFPMNDAWMAEFVWAPDSRSLYVTMNEGTFTRQAAMFQMPIVRLTLADGKTSRVVAGAATVDYSISLSLDGRMLAYRAVAARDVGTLNVLDLSTGSTRAIVDPNPQLAALTLGTLEPISWTSFDGMEIWGLLLRPPGWKAGARVATLVYCHGGPIGGVTLGLFPQFMHVPGQIDPYPVEALASAGFAVLFPMPRGGSGYGEAGHRMIVNDWGGPDYRDIMAGVDHLVAQGIADPDRLGVMGASYGGFMTNWIVSQTRRFKAASAGASISDLTDVFYLTDGGDLLIEYFKRPWENRDGYASHSPITFAGQVTTPLLMQHGERDPRVPVASAQKFHRALQLLGKTVELDIYPGGGHVMYQPVQERHQMQRNLDWFLSWIRP